MKNTTMPSPRVQILQPGNHPQVQPTEGRVQQRPKKRAGAYVRISTTHEDQEGSYEAQQTHFRSLIEQDQEMELIDIYADEESGTSADKRENFMRMIRDCEAHRLDVILTKSVSRFARNTLDALKYIRKLKALGVAIIFTKEGINTMDSSGEVLLTIMSSIAQQESASISQNVQLGVRYHYQEGKVCSGVYRLLGYTRTRNGSLEIIPEEADIVRRIFREYLDGYSMSHIAERLTADGVDGTKTTITGIEIPRTWNEQGIEYILQNEKYAGDLLLQKYYTVDFLTKKVAANRGQLPQYYVENSHAPIIPKKVFLQVQTEIIRRRKNPRQFRYMHGNGLSGLIVCGECGTPFRMRRDGKAIHWRCESKVNRKRYPDVQCPIRRGIRDEAVKTAVVTAFNRLPDYREELIRLHERIRWGGLNRADEVLRSIEAQMEGLQDNPAEEETLRSLEARWQEACTQRAEYADAEVQVRNLIERIETSPEEAESISMDGSCHTAEDFFRMTRPAYAAGAVTVFSDDETRKFVEQIVVKDDIVTVSFKAGITVEVER